MSGDGKGAGGPGAPKSGLQGKMAATGEQREPWLTEVVLDDLARYSVKHEVRRCEQGAERAKYLTAGVKMAAGTPVASGPVPHNGLMFDRDIVSAMGKRADTSRSAHAESCPAAMSSPPSQRMSTTPDNLHQSKASKSERSKGSNDQRAPSANGPKARHAHHLRPMDMSQRPGTRERWKAKEWANVESRVFQEVARPSQAPTRFDKLSVRELLGRVDSRSEGGVFEDGASVRGSTAATSRASTALSMHSSANGYVQADTLAPCAGRVLNAGGTMRITGTPSKGTSVFKPRDMWTPRQATPEIDIPQGWRAGVPNLGTVKDAFVRELNRRTRRYVGVTRPGSVPAPYLRSHMCVNYPGACFVDVRAPERLPSAKSRS